MDKRRQKQPLEPETMKHQNRGHFKTSAQLHPLLSDLYTNPTFKSYKKRNQLTNGTGIIITRWVQFHKYIEYPERYKCAHCGAIASLRKKKKYRVCDNCLATYVRLVSLGKVEPALRVWRVAA